MIRSQITALALNVWREATRDRLVHLLVGSGAILMVFSMILGDMAVGGAERIIQNFGFWIIGIWGLMAVLYLGSNIIRREIQQKTIYLILSRPVNRATFIISKYIGMLLVLFTAYLLILIVWMIILQVNSISITKWHLIAVAFIFGEWMFLAALSLFFASFTTPILHNFFLIGISFLGHWTNDLRLFSENIKILWMKPILKAIYYVLPNLEALNFREPALYQEMIPPELFWQGAFVLIGWIAIALIAANLIFMMRRQL